MKGNFYITTTLPYVNAAPHIGHALEFVQADILARYHRLRGEEVFFNTGVDEHGAKVYQRAVEEKKDPQLYVDEYAEKFKKLYAALDVDYTHFVRTTDRFHMRAAQEFWRQCDENGDIEKKLYRISYCVGCELEKTDSELEHGRCPVHPTLEIEIREEENYFFKFSRYQEKLLQLYEKRPDFVVPDSRFDELKRFVKKGLHDFSISRLKEKMPWGVPVPGDPDHVMYVWFDALINYISTLGWPEDEKAFKKFWPGVQVAGKDQIRQQAAMWQAMLVSAGLPNSEQIIIHGFITSGGKKMSKSVGNVIDPFAVVEKYGTDAFRYWLAREMTPFEDGDFTWKKFDERYQGDLVNGLGNFAARILTLADQYVNGVGFATMRGSVDATVEKAIIRAHESMQEKLKMYAFHEALAALWELIAFGDGYVNKKEPWRKSLDESKRAGIILNLVVILDHVAALLVPFLPETADKIMRNVMWRKDGSLKVKKGKILFPRVVSPKR